MFPKKKLLLKHLNIYLPMCVCLLMEEEKVALRHASGSLNYYIIIIVVSEWQRRSHSKTNEHAIIKSFYFVSETTITAIPWKICHDSQINHERLN